MPKKVKVARGRTVLEIPEDRVGDAQARGYAVVDDSGAKSIGQASSAADLAGGVRGFTGAFASGATFGGSNVALKALGADPGQLQADQEGGIGTVGEVAGAIAPAVLSGGAGAVGAAARLTPAGAAARLGTGAGNLVRGAGGVARTGAALAVEGTVEGGLQGAGDAISDAVLNDAPLTAEKVVAGAGTSAGLGLLLGGGLGVAGSGLAGAVRRAAPNPGRMLNRAADATDVGLQNAAMTAASRDSVIKTWAKVAGVDQGALKRSIDRLGTEEGARRMIGDLSATRDKVARSLKGGVDKANDAWDNLIRTTGGDARIGNAERLMTEAENAVAPRHASEFLQAERKRVDDLLGDDLLTSAQKRDLKQIARQNEVAQRTIRERGSGAEAFRAVDRYKQDVATIARSRGDEFARGAVREVGEAAKLARTFDDATKGHLFDEAIYGAAGKAHRESNEAWATAIGAADDLRRRSPQLGKLFKRGADEADLDTMLRLARKHTRTGGETTVDAFDAAIDARIAAAKKLRENNDLTPEVKAKIDDFEREVGSMRKELREQSEHAAAVDDLQKLRDGETNYSPTQSIVSTIGPAAGAAIGGALGGGAGAAAGLALGQVMAPSRVLRTMASLRSITGKVSLDTSSAVAGFAKLAEQTTGRAKRAVRQAPRVARTAAQRLQAKQDRDKRLRAAIHNVNRYATDPSLLADDLRDDDLFTLAPNVSGNAMATAARGVQYLQMVAPASYKPTYGGGVEMFDPVEMSQYEHAYEAVTQPMAAAARLSTGTMTVEHAKALRYVYPMLYAEIQNGIMEELGRREQAGQPVGFKARTQLSILGDMPADDSMRPESLAMIATAHQVANAEEAAEQANFRSGGTNSDVSRRTMRTERDRIAMGGESS